jgi:prepilin-type N-terminal cleavage/methylation domain-containing protein
MSGQKRRGLSIIEVVVVVVILGVIAALAIPTLSKGAVNDDEALLRERVALLRTAIELYYDDHGFYPGGRPAGQFPAGSSEAFVNQLVKFTDAAGAASDSPSERFCLGPYLRDGIPVCPVSTPVPSEKAALIDGDDFPRWDRSLTDVGWVYNWRNGYIAANSSGVDARGVRYDSY